MEIFLSAYKRRANWYDRYEKISEKRFREENTDEVYAMLEETKISMKQRDLEYPIR